jgi:SAM-dependent methyltransferase
VAGAVDRSFTIVFIVAPSRSTGLDTRQQCRGSRRLVRGSTIEPVAGRSGRRVIRFHRGVLLTALLLVASGAVAAPLQAPQFPAVGRPVAPIISPAYSTEEERDRLGEAEKVMSRLQVRPGMRVADIGAGDGYYTVRLARRLGPGATVYAEDVEPRHLERLAARLAREGVVGVTLVQGTAADPRLPERFLDLALLAHVYHEIQHPYEFLYRLISAMAPHGRVAIIDNDRPTEAHGTPPALLRCELAALGYRQIDFVSLAAADGYLAVFVPPQVLPAPADIRPCRRRAR